MLTTPPHGDKRTHVHARQAAAPPFTNQIQQFPRFHLVQIGMSFGILSPDLGSYCGRCVIQLDLLLRACIDDPIDVLYGWIWICWSWIWHVFVTLLTLICKHTVYHTCLTSHMEHYVLLPESGAPTTRDPGQDVLETAQQTEAPRGTPVV